MNLKDFLEDCKREDIIDQSTVDKMYAHFLVKQKQNADSFSNTKQSSNNGLLITIGIIGVVLIGFGIIYLFAHNWDQLSRTTKTVLSMMPVFISIAANVFTLTKRKDNVVWQESTAVSTFLAVGSMLALILQIYQLPGIENYFFFYWAFLCLPIVYLLQSHGAVFCVMLLLLFNLMGNPLDQSTIIRVPWFGSLILFLTLIPYFKKLFSDRKPETVYTLQQLFLPLIICLSVIINMHSSESSIWIITFLIMINFHLFGTSIFLRNNNRSINLMSLLSYIGVSFSISYLLFQPNWNFQEVFKDSDYRVYFIPLLFLLALFQIAHYFKKEKIEFNNLYKLILFYPLPFILLNYIGYDVHSFFQITTILTCFGFIYIGFKSQNELFIYPALTFIALILGSFLFTANLRFSLFYFSLILSIYYLIPMLVKKENKNGVIRTDFILIVALQLLVLIIASFEGFWIMTRYSSTPLSNFQFSILLLIIACSICFTILAYSSIKTHFSGVFGIFSILVPSLIFIGCVSPIGIQHVFSVLLLFFGITMLIFGAKRSNLSIANLSIGLIGIVLICRFFDLKMSLTVKGLIFIAIGSSFFLANYLIFKSKKNEHQK